MDNLAISLLVGSNVILLMISVWSSKNLRDVKRTSRESVLAYADTLEGEQRNVVLRLLASLCDEEVPKLVTTIAALDPRVTIGKAGSS
jgi:hypothetical protein